MRNWQLNFETAKLFISLYLKRNHQITKAENGEENKRVPPIFVWLPFLQIINRHTVSNNIVTITIVGVVLIVARLSFGTRDGHFKRRMLFTPTAREKRESNTSFLVIWIRRCNCVIIFTKLLEDSCWVSSPNLSPAGSCNHIIGVHGVRFRDRVKWKTQYMKSNCGLHQPSATSRFCFKRRIKLQNTWMKIVYPV